MGESFVSRQEIAFGDTDPAGILYYPRWFHYCHRAMEEMCGAVLGKSYALLLKEEGLGFPTVAIQADYRGPLPYGNVVEIEVTLEHIGTSSVRWHYRGKLESEDDHRVEAHVTTVCVDMASFESKPIPDAIRGEFECYLEN